MRATAQPQAGCPSEEDLARFVAGDLLGSSIAVFDEHLAACPECRGLVAELARSRALPGASSSMTNDPTEPRNEGPSPNKVPPHLPPGTRIGRYVLGSVLGSGGMGVAYLATDPALNRQVTLKLVRKDRQDRPNANAEVLREAQAMAALSHPNVVAIYDVGVYLGQVFLAMEFVEGRTLSDWLKEQPRPFGEILPVLIDAGRGLAAAHGVGIVHRDFKPANVLVGRDGRVRVADFGLARPVTAMTPGSGDSSGDEAQGKEVSEYSVLRALTQAGAVKGTPAYMAPEQFAGEAVSPGTDQFGFCMTAFEALTGHRPRRRVPHRDRASREDAGIALPPEVESMPPHLLGVLRRGLATDPIDRFESMDALLLALTAPPPTIQTPLPPRRRLAMALAALGITTALAWSWLRTLDGTNELEPRPEASAAHLQAPEQPLVEASPPAMIPQAPSSESQTVAPLPAATAEPQPAPSARRARSPRSRRPAPPQPPPGDRSRPLVGNDQDGLMEPSFARPAP